MQGGTYSAGESQEPYLDFYLDGSAHLDETFEFVALDIFEPLLECYTPTPFKASLQLKNYKDL